MAWRATNPSAAAPCHTCHALGRSYIDSFHGLGCTEGWGPVSHMDRSNPAPRSTGLFPPTGGILLGKVLEFLEQSLSSPCPRRDARGELLAAK